MDKKYNHLVWIGAHSATEPAGLLNQTHSALLIEAREAACSQLEMLYNQYPDTKIEVQAKLISPEGAEAEFIIYNLPEYSATSPVSGLKSLLPGLKAVHQEKRQTQSLADIIYELNLTDDNNQLVLDIPDLNLPLLETLTQNSLLSLFSSLHIHAGEDSLYDGAVTREDIVSWLQEQGFAVDLITASDPDMPWVAASKDHAWQQLQALQLANKKINRELKKSQKQLLIAEDKVLRLKSTQNKIQEEQKAKLAQNAEQIEQLKQEVASLKAKEQKSQAQLEEAESLLEGVKSQLEESQKNSAELVEREKDLNNKLNEQTYRNTNLEHEVIKLEAQLELITKVLLQERAL